MEMRGHATSFEMTAKSYFFYCVHAPKGEKEKKTVYIHLRYEIPFPFLIFIACIITSSFEYSTSH